MASSRWHGCMPPWEDLTYAKEIHEYLKKKELKRTLYMRSPQLYWRTNLVNFLKLSCDQLNLSSLVFHLSVLLLDHFMDNHSIDSYKLKPVAVACLSVAAKYEELDDNLPRSSQLLQLNNNLKSKRELFALELAVQSHFHWSLGAPTAKHFLDYYALFALSPSNEDLKSIMRERLEFYLDIYILDPTLMRYRSSEVAATLVLCARRDLGLVPPWTNQLMGVTGYTFLELEDCLHHLESSSQIALSPEQRKRKSDSLDLGYESMSPADGKKLKLM